MSGVYFITKSCVKAGSRRLGVQVPLGGPAVASVPHLEEGGSRRPPGAGRWPERVHDRHDARALIARLNPEQLAEARTTGAKYHPGTDADPGCYNHTGR